jgi:hypothetical protein
LRAAVATAVSVFSFVGSGQNQYVTPAPAGSDTEWLGIATLRASLTFSSRSETVPTNGTGALLVTKHAPAELQLHIWSANDERFSS